jgi:hypothetical protein
MLRMNCNIWQNLSFARKGRFGCYSAPKSSTSMLCDRNISRRYQEFLQTWFLLVWLNHSFVHSLSSRSGRIFLSQMVANR